MKNGELLYDAALAQVEQMPDSKRDIVRSAFADCKDKGKRTYSYTLICFVLHKVFGSCWRTEMRICL